MEAHETIREAVADLWHVSGKWLIQSVLCTRTITILRKNKSIKPTLRLHTFGGEGRSFLICRSDILRLLRKEKSVHDQLIVELPCLMGFRSEEVATWKAEYIDFENEDCLVMDAKKHKLFPVPLNRNVAKHAEMALHGRSNGYVIENESTAWRNRTQPITTTAVWYAWQRHTNSYSPISGRRFFAAEWFYTQGLSAATLQRILRHNNIETTLRYVSQIIFYEDLKRDYDKFQFNVMEDMIPQIKEAKVS